MAKSSSEDSNLQPTPITKPALNNVKRDEYSNFPNEKSQVV